MKYTLVSIIMYLQVSSEKYPKTTLNPTNPRAWFANFAIERHMVGMCILVARVRPRRCYTEVS